MDLTLPENQNSLIQGSFLDSKFFDPAYLFNQGVKFFDQLFNYTISSNVINIFYIILSALSVFFIAIIFYSIIRVFEIRAKEKKHLEHEIEEYAHHYREQERKLQEGEAISKNPRWVTVLNYIFSNQASDWKLAVIEADSMLLDLMDQLGFKGENLGEKLKLADKDKFRGLASAWEAHTVRNRIAHEGLAFQLSAHEAKRIIALYEQIFREFGYI